MNQNPNCDNYHCTKRDGEVRVLPTGGGGNAILCFVCFMHEMNYRLERNATKNSGCAFEIPAWMNLEIYGNGVAA